MSANRDADLRVIGVTWFGMLVSLGVYGALVVGIGPARDLAMDELSYGLAAAAALPAVLSVVIGRFVRGSYRTQVLVRSALAESVGLLGVVVGFVGGPPVVWVGLIGISAVLMVGAMPTPRAYDDFSQS